MKKLFLFGSIDLAFLLILNFGSLLLQRIFPEAGGLPIVYVFCGGVLLGGGFLTLAYSHRRLAGLALPFFAVAGAAFLGFLHTILDIPFTDREALMATVISFSLYLLYCLPLLIPAVRRRYEFFFLCFFTLCLLYVAGMLFFRKNDLPVWFLSLVTAMILLVFFVLSMSCSTDLWGNLYCAAIAPISPLMLIISMISRVSFPIGVRPSPLRETYERLGDSAAEALPFFSASISPVDSDILPEE